MPPKAIRLVVPTRLPTRADGSRLEVLSASSISLLYRCPELWRRRYMERVKDPATERMHMGSSVDAAITGYYRAALVGHQATEKEVLDWFNTSWQEREAQITFTRDPGAARECARRALLSYIEDVASTVKPRAVQRTLSARLAPDLDWAVTGVLDLETQDGQVIDIKTGSRHRDQAEAERGLQPGIYLWLRMVEGDPACGFAFHSLRVPTGGPRSTPGVKVVPATWDPKRVLTAPVRMAAAARLITGLARQFGPTGPWPYADPGTWQCAPEACPAWGTCPAGAGPA